jgi:hypothetical protein
VGDALHQIAVAADEVRVVIDYVMARLVERRGEMRFGDGHADGVADALAKRSSRRLDSGGVAVLRVTGGTALPLAELLDVVEREAVTGEVQAGVQQHRRVAARQDEAVAIGPFRVGGVVSHDPREQHVADGSERHRRTGVSGFGLLDGVHGQGPDGVDAEQIEIARRHFGCGSFLGAGDGSRERQKPNADRRCSARVFSYDRVRRLPANCFRPVAAAGHVVSRVEESPAARTVAGKGANVRRGRPGTGGGRQDCGND